jgi:hypothetical protein
LAAIIGKDIPGWEKRSRKIRRRFQVHSSRLTVGKTEGGQQRKDDGRQESRSRRSA